MKRSSRLVLLFASMCACSLLASTHAFPGDVQTSIRIGEVDPLTGKLSQHGIEIHEGILYAVEQVNAAGGIRNRQVELESRDDQSQPEVAINQAEDLLYRQGAVGLVGGYVDSLVGPISELAAKHHVPYVASASLQRSLSHGRKNPYFFRVSELGGIVRPLCGFVTDVLRPSRAAILYSATPGSTEFAREVKEGLERAGICIPIFEKFRPGSPDLTAFLLKVRQADIDVLISGGFFPDHLVLVRQLIEQQIPLKAYIGPWGIGYPGFIKEMGGMSEHLFGMCAWAPGITLSGTETDSESFIDGFRKRFQKVPNTTTMHGYASARALLAAIDKALENENSLSGDAIRRQLTQLDLMLPLERLAFDEAGDPKDYRQAVVQIQGGNLVVVAPADRATGKAIYPMRPSDR